MKPIVKYCSWFAVLTFIVACGDNKFKSNVVANQNASFKIWGNCEMCKETIEGSLRVDGIKTVDWNKDTKIITVAFDSTMISLDQIEKNIAIVGYDTEKYKGNDSAYADLPGCCQYQRKN